MTTEVIHTKNLEDGSVRVTLDEPHGINQAHRKVIVHTSGLQYDHKGKRLATRIDPDTGVPETFEQSYMRGDEVGYIEIFLAGQTQFSVPPQATSIEFDDGTVFSLAAAPDAAPALDPNAPPATV